MCSGSFDLSFPQSVQREVDILFIIDNSGSMAGEQARLRQQFPRLMAELDTLPGGRPSVHIGVTSTDLDVWPYQIQRCDTPDQGRLLVPTDCDNPVGAPYIVDVDPHGCGVLRVEDGTCLAHDCDESHCEREPGSWFVETALGCPACRNHRAQNLSDVFSCLGNLGTMGCGFEQPLEAMALALAPDNDANAGFLRPSSVLAVIIITDEDDCSAATPRLFNDAQTDINSQLGPITSFRCFEFGVLCDINERTHQGMRQNCRPRADPQAMLHPIDRYVSLLRELKPASQLVVAAITGPYEASVPGPGGNVTVGLDGYS